MARLRDVRYRYDGGANETYDLGNSFDAKATAELPYAQTLGHQK